MLKFECVSYCRVDVPLIVGRAIDKNNAIQIEIPQLNSIIRSYNHGKLNQRSPISTEIDYQFKWCWPFIHKQTLKN